MSFLDELEVKVRDLLKKYQDSLLTIQRLEAFQKTLQDTCTSLETALLHESTQVKTLLEEKESIKMSIDELLANIKTLEEMQK